MDERSAFTIAFGAFSVAIQAIEAVRKLYEFGRNVKEASEDFPWILEFLEDSHDLALFCRAALQWCSKKAYLDTNVASLLESYQEACAQLSTISPDSGFRNCIRCYQKSEAIRFSKARHKVVGSCEWFLKRDIFLKWRNTTESSVLWVSGSPGTGKSTLCASIIDSIEADGRTGEAMAFYFADGRFKTSNVAFDILGTMAVKILSGKISARSRGCLETLLMNLDAAREQLSSSQIREFLLRMWHSLSDGETLYVVLDGLDEVENLQSTVDFLREVVRLGKRSERWHSLKFLVASRPDLLHGKDLRGTLQVDIDTETSVQTDIVAYVRQNIQKMQPSNFPLESYSPETFREGHWQLSGPTSVFSCVFQPIALHRSTFQQKLVRYEIFQRLAEEITRNAQGNFLWAFLVVEDVSRNSHFHCSIGKLVHISITGNCSDIYRSMIGRISEEDRPVALQILRWVVHAARPLYSWELGDATESQMNINLVDKDILRICGGLLTKTRGGTVSLVHSSVRDYLDSQRGENDILGWGAVSDKSNEMIAHTCLRVLSPDLLLESLIAATGNETLHEDEIPPDFLGYAFCYWRFHYNLGEHRSAFLPGMVHEKLGKAWNHGELSSGLLNQAKYAFFGSERNPLGLLDAILRAAARFGMIKLVKLELEMGARPDCKDKLGNTPLHYATLTGNLEIILLLIEYGVNIQAISSSGHTPLSHAVAAGQAQAVNLLLARGPKDDDTRLENHQNPNLPTHQKLSLVVSLSDCCSDCGDIQSHYVLSETPGIGEGSKMSPPIRVMGETISLAECGLSGMQKNAASSYGGSAYFSEQRTIIKWFPGVNMYKALGVAARSGMEDVVRLLVTAGNDVKFLDRNFSLSRIMSKMEVPLLILNCKR